MAVVLVASICNGAAQETPASGQSSPEESKLLRPAVERDLRKLIRTVFNDTATASDLDEEFNRCTFTRLNLGPLGEGVLVEAQPGHGKSNAAFLNLYAPSGSGFRRILEGSGFGPYTLPGRNGPPDLVFGWTEGVCTAKYYRYHYANGVYTPNGCAQETQGKPKTGESCAIRACQDLKKLALFDPPTNKDDSDGSPK